MAYINFHTEKGICDEINTAPRRDLGYEHVSYMCFMHIAVVINAKLTYMAYKAYA